MRFCFLMVSLLAGCGGAAVPGSVHFELGTADILGDGFLPLKGDQTLVSGAQGGFHIWLKYRAYGMSGQTVRMLETARRDDSGDLVRKSPLLEEQVGSAGDEGYFEEERARPGFMCPAPLGVKVRDQSIHFEVKFMDGQDHPLDKQGTSVTVRCPSGDGQEYCEKVCSG